MRYDKLPPHARAIIWCAVSTTQQAGDDRASMEEQEKWAMETCQKNGWQVVDILRVPGHSRNYKDINTLASDARAKGIDAFDRLIAHLERADFDVFICRDANRFARRASLLHYIIESIIDDCGAVIYSQHDGWVDSSNAAGFSAMKGYSTTQDMRWIREGMKIGKEKLVKRGIPPSGIVSSSHKKVRDVNTGKTTAIVVNDEMLDLYLAVGELLLEGLAWNQMGEALYKRWGIVNRTGNLYDINAIYYRLYNPIIWGNLANGRTKYPVGEWVFYDHPSKPKGLVIEYGVTPPIYDGRFAHDVRDELIRRLDIRGKSKPSSSYRFSAMCVCGICGNSMAVASANPRTHGVKPNTYGGRYRVTDEGRIQWGVTCQYKYKKDVNGNRCTGNFIKQEALEAFLTQLMYYMLDGKPMSDYFNPDDLLSPNEPTIEQITTQIEKAREQIRVLVRKQSLAPESVHDIYQSEILKLSDQILEWDSSLVHLETRQRDMNLIDEYAKENMQVENFWNLSDLEINQMLKGLLRDYRLVILNNEVIGMKLVY